MVDHVVRVRRPDGGWVTLGTEEARGVVPEGLSLSADLHGPSSCGFTLRRPADVIWSELQAANQVQVDVDGVPVWGGRINQTPAAGKGVGEQISVSAQGWVAHLGDDQVTIGWVTRNLGGFTDTRALAGVDLTRYTAAGAAGTGQQVSLSWPPGATVKANDVVGVTLDFGPGRGHNFASVQFDRPGSNSDTQLYVRGSNTRWGVGVIPSYQDLVSGVTLNTYAATGNSVGGVYTGTPGYRYLHVFLLHPAGGTWGTAVAQIVITGLTAGTRPRDVASGQSALIASNVVTDALDAGAAPLIDSADRQITPTSFVIPEFWPDGHRTPREIIEAVNAFHDYLWGVDALRRPYFRPRPTDPLFEVGSFSGGQFDDTSLGNLDRIYNRVIVEYAGPDGVSAIASRTNPSTILTRQGVTRTYRLAVQATLTQAAAEQIGDVWLTKHANAPLAGSITVAPGDIRTTHGTPVHPSILLTKTGERIRLTGQIDPVTGAVGRVGTIVAVTYNPAAETAGVQLDNDNQSLETWLSRLAVIQGAGR